MSVRPDSAVVSDVVASPNHGERIGSGPDMLILHYTGMPTAEGALQRLCEPAAQVSAHYFVFEDGRVVQMVPEERRAWHAGLGSWQGERDINSRSIGVEIANPGHAGGLPPYPQAQIAAVIALCRDIVARRGIAAPRVLAHSDVAPERKEDPGELFPWDRLAGAGIGHHVPPVPLRDGAVLAPGDAGEAVAELQARLAAYGYPQAQSGLFDRPMQAVVMAFQRHFRQERVDGVADLSTVETLEALLAALPGSA